MGKFILFAGILCLLWDHLPRPSFTNLFKWMSKHSFGLTVWTIIGIDFLNIGYFSYVSHFNLTHWYAPVMIIESILFALATFIMLIAIDL